MEMTFSEPTQEDLEFLSGARDLLPEVAEYYLPDWKGGEFTPKLLDEIFKAWLEASEEFDTQDIVDSVGVATGDWMVKNCQMEWKVIEDQYGTALGTHREKPRYTCYPIDSVGKRVQSREVDFLQTICELAKP